ncbi:RagB/SusD family nutrient uptake outer membrane protein [Puia dinghuensis]|uniref:Membrane protein n=1 Tax=Puia dinghuensis TaxID=1792502 RepID=A0A8J2UK83_9BACT|nr:RagB/SusD family nutrient uptake outer membrane protein [Puia dinghuensis]GGB25436.1 membrane protein [Puia dinghuensis]
MRSFSYLSICILVSASLVSCKKYVDPGTPTNLLTVDKVYTDSLSTLGVVLSLYSKWTTNQSNGTPVSYLCQFGAMSADDAYYFNNSQYDPYRTNTLSAGSLGNVVYTFPYQSINTANNAIAGITGSQFSTSYKNQLLGECKFWRAYAYFNLVNYFGGVPLVLGATIATNATLPRSSTDAVYTQIVTDLKDAENLLSTTYPSAEKARVNKYAVSALLARVYLYQKNWTAAEAEATTVISSGSYSLEPNLNNVFIKTSNETIWQMVSNVSAGITGVTAMGINWIPSGTTPAFVLYDTLAKTFEATDQRKVNWTKSLSYNGTTFYYPYKYKIRINSVSGNEYNVMFRLAEQYLIRSEARAMQNNITGAQSDLNMVRSRAGLGNTTAATQAGLLTALEKERWVELFTEMSDRWFNLKRTGRIDAVLSLTKPQWQPFQALYPIPISEITANPYLTQNPGY